MKICVFLICFMFISIGRSTTIVYVDSQAATNGDGSQTTPYSNIASAISSLENGLFQLSDADSRIMLVPRTKSYTLAGLKITGPAAASFVIMATTTSNLQSQNYP